MASSVDEILLDRGWPILQDQRKTARIITPQQITTGPARVVCDDLQQPPTRAQRGHTLREPTAEQTIRTTASPGPSGIRTTYIHHWTSFCPILLSAQDPTLELDHCAAPNQ